MSESGIPPNRRYIHDDGLNAAKDFLKWLDLNSNRVITPSEIEDVIVKVIGYSWGGISAVGFAQRFSQPGTITVGGSPNNPITYQLQQAVPITLVFTIDPVKLLNPPGTVPPNVNKFTNYYQKKGGKGIFRRPNGTKYKEIGNFVSGKFKGVQITSAAQSTYQLRVDTVSPVTICKGYPLKEKEAGELWLASNEVNHDVMPWFVHTEATDAMK